MKCTYRRTALAMLIGLISLGPMGCPTATSTPDDGSAPADPTALLLDSGLHNTAPGSPIDAGQSSNDNPGDASGFGTITGDCGLIDGALLSQATPTLIENAIDFADDPYDESDYEALTEGGQEILDDGNAGGSSILSEVFAYEVLHRCEGATLLKPKWKWCTTIRPASSPICWWTLRAPKSG